MDGEPLTIRQLGAKTSKSTGVLDQAMKKLQKKNIIKRSVINEVPKYSLDSLETVVQWMQDDMEQKREMLLRRHQNFESFVTSLESGNKRPDMEYFDGESGIKQAYIKLLNGPGEIFHYLPVIGKEEEDPLRDFRVQYFRERQQRKMFSRVIAHDTSLGRRYQSRDPFEYRKTVLVPEGEYPFNFEKIITGERIACIDHKAKTACVLRYPELADIEKTLFEAIWKQVQQKAISESGVTPELQAVQAATEKIALSTETISQVREFFLSKRSWVAFGVCAVLAMATTFLMYRQNLDTNLQRIRERVKSIAATAALQFDANDIDQIWTAEDIQKPEYARLIHLMNRVRRENDGVKYVYIMRPTEEFGVWEFVADADAIDPFNIQDYNRNGVIDEADHLSPPGEKYYEDLSEEAWSLEEPMGSSGITTDQWGSFITGSAPIRDDNDRPVAIVGVDVEAGQLYHLSNTSFKSIFYFLGFFALFVLIRFMAFNPRFLRELSGLLQVRTTVLFVVGGLGLTIVISAFIYARGIASQIEFARSRIQTIATTGALEFSARDIVNLQTIEDTARPEYQTIIEKLYQIRAQNDDIQYAYLIRPTPKDTLFEFIADADAYNRNLLLENDINKDGVFTESDEVGYPGLPYDVSHISLLREGKYFTPVSTEEPFTDKWGTVLTGYAPIFDDANILVGLLAIDANASDIYIPTIATFVPVFIYVVLLIAFVFYMQPSLTQGTLLFVRKLRSRKILYGLVFVGMGVYWVAFGAHFYFQQRKYEEVGKRLMAIAATAASEFDAAELDGLRFKRDIETPEYQRAFKKLNQIRNNNPEIKWIYILRPSGKENVWQFVVDADANSYINSEDISDDGILDETDEVVAPGVIYSYEWDVLNEALNKPSYSKSPETDQWGTFITGAAPIMLNGKPVAVLSIDVSIDEIWD